MKQTQKQPARPETSKQPFNKQQSIESQGKDKRPMSVDKTTPKPADRNGKHKGLIEKQKPAQTSNRKYSA